MPPIYKFLAEFAQTWGLAYFIAVFVLVLGYTFWPSRREGYENAARMPLQED